MICYKRIFISLFFGYLPAVLFSQNEDTLRHIELPAITIVDSVIRQRPLEQSNTTIDKIIIEKQPASSVGDVAKFIPGVNVKDYGGLGGLKTVSVRGLGTTHTAIIYDGIAVSDYMNGQIDLSKYSTGNIKEVSMSNGQDFSLLQPAKALSSSNIFIIQTNNPKFETREKVSVSAYCSYGSFNYFNPGFALAWQMTKKLITKLDFDLINTAGNYPYVLHYGNNANDSTSKETRQNADLFSTRIELNNYFTFSPKTDLKVKMYYFYSNRGLPSATIYYYQNSGQRLWDKNAFIQSVLTHRFDERFTYRNHTKISTNFTHYLDTKVLNANGFQSDIYQQQEAYINNVIAYSGKKIKLSLTNDLAYNTLDATSNISTLPKRFSSLTAMVVDYSFRNLTLNTNLLHSYYSDNTTYANIEKYKSSFHPFASLSYGVKNFAVSVFFKDVLRNPTFNELYYNRIGTPNLKPERTRQYNLHTAYLKNIETRQFFQLNASLDVYYNQVFDKIVAMPQRNLFIWSMVNYGRVLVQGIDALLGFRTNIYGFDVRLQGTYSYQYAVDDEKNSITYQQQIPYTPRSSGSLFALLSYKSYSISYTLSFVGRRYVFNENISANRLNPYNEHSISLQKTFKEKLALSLSVINLFDAQYEVVRNYPMPMRQFRIKVNYNFNSK
ncbi:MAG: TonB-dependent receptor [Bacteroidales bacterium]|jgi:outer membrane cobalamin receptor|nr:TonB-dependent receptor [Bacteroidales bacterium]